MNGHEDRLARVNYLIANFQTALQAFEENPPFKRMEQLAYHQKTIALGKELKTVNAAVDHKDFAWSLYQTLQAWGIGSRGSHLKPFEEFHASLNAKTNEIQKLEGKIIDQQGLHPQKIASEIFSLIKSLEIVTNRTTIVAGTKALHHLLPDLVVPIDRAYTQNYFGWSTQQFQYHQKECFEEAFISFVEVARKVNPQQYVGVNSPWNTSRTKVLDNALVGILVIIRNQLRGPN
jgi:hypothetical protein